MEYSLSQKQSQNNLMGNYYRLPSGNSQVSDLYFQINKQLLDMVNTKDLADEVKMEQLKNIEAILQNDLIRSSYISGNDQYNSNVRPFDYRKVKYNDDTPSIDSTKVISLSDKFAYANSFISYIHEERGEDIMTGNNNDISDIANKYTSNLAPSIPLGMIIGIIATAFKIAMDYVFAPLVILVSADFILNGLADFFTHEKEGKVFKKIIQYFSIFFILTWLIILELILLQYNLVSIIKPIIEGHWLVYSFLGAAALMSLKNIRESAKRLELPVSPFAKIFRFAAERVSPDVIKYLEKFTDDKENGGKDKNKPKG